MDRDASAPPPHRAALVCRTGGLLLPPADAAEDGTKKAAKKRRAGMDSVAPRAALLLPPADAAEDGNKTKKRRAGMDSVAPRAAALVCPLLPLADDDAAQDGGGGGKKRAAQAARALPPPLHATTVEADAGKKKKKKIVAAEGGVNNPDPAERSGIVAKNKTRSRLLRVREALLDQALRSLPPPLDPRIRAEGGGGDYDPYALHLFLHHRAVLPWDALWESRPLVLHDRRLVETVAAQVMRPRYLSDEPRDQVEAVTRLLGYHPGPVSSFRLQSSRCPDTQVLALWMDALSDKGVAELVVFSLYGGDDTATTRFPLERLSTDILAVLALGFFRIAEEELTVRSCWCDGIRSLVTLSLTGCTFSVSTLSSAVSKLKCLTTLTVTSCNLTRPGRAAIGRHEDQGGLIVDSLSLLHLRLCMCAGTKLTIEYAPVLKYLEIGITSCVTGTATGVQKVCVVVREAAALRELHAVALRLHVLEIHGAKGPAFKWKKREALHNLTVLGIALNFCISEQAALFMELLSQFPALLELRVSRVDDLPPSGNDDLGVYQSWYLGPVPKCLRSTLQKLVIHDYRGGNAEIALLTRLLQGAASLASLSVYLHASIVSSEEAVASQIQDLPRASKLCRISVVSADYSS